VSAPPVQDDEQTCTVVDTSTTLGRSTRGEWLQRLEIIRRLHSATLWARSRLRAQRAQICDALVTVQALTVDVRVREVHKSSRRAIQSAFPHGIRTKE